MCNLSDVLIAFGTRKGAHPGNVWLKNAQFSSNLGFRELIARLLAFVVGTKANAMNPIVKQISAYAFELFYWMFYGSNTRQ
jgi:hypothetical protein